MIVVDDDYPALDRRWAKRRPEKLRMCGTQLPGQECNKIRKEEGERRREKREREKEREERNKKQERERERKRENKQERKLKETRCQSRQRSKESKREKGTTRDCLKIGEPPQRFSFWCPIFKPKQKRPHMPCTAARAQDAFLSRRKQSRVKTTQVCLKATFRELGCPQIPC